MDFLLGTELIGSLLDVVGKIMVAYTAVRVHYRVWKEHKIDDRVFREMKQERNVAIIGIALIIVGFILESYVKINT